MRFLFFRKKNLIKCVISGLFILLCLLLAYSMYSKSASAVRIVMGGRLQMESETVETATAHPEKDYDEKYFRPSNLPIINTKVIKSDLLLEQQDKDPSEIVMPEQLLKTPEDTLLNYFSILKHAENLEEGRTGGCGTVGEAKLPYPLAYGFLTSDHQKKLSYSKYLESFKGIGHINLIKLKGVPKDKKQPEYLRYFVELETIEGSSKGVTYFAYYYGYVFIAREGNRYRIADVKLWGEDFLCAPYHGWAHNAEASVDIRYGEWCKLIKKRYPTKCDGYVKDIFFEGTDGKDYLIKFFQLTNGTDTEIAQYRKNLSGLWELVTLEPEKCLQEKQ